MLAVAAWVVVAATTMAWRLSGPTLSLGILGTAVLALTIAAVAWSEVARRPRVVRVPAPFIDLEQVRIAELDALASESTAKGENPVIATTGWFDEGAQVDRTG